MRRLSGTETTLGKCWVDCNRVPLAGRWFRFWCISCLPSAASGYTSPETCGHWTTGRACSSPSRWACRLQKPTLLKQGRGGAWLLLKTWLASGELCSPPVEPLLFSKSGGSRASVCPRGVAEAGPHTQDTEQVCQGVPGYPPGPSATFSIVNKWCNSFVFNKNYEFLEHVIFSKGRALVSCSVSEPLELSPPGTGGSVRVRAHTGGTRGALRGVSKLWSLKRAVFLTS